MRLLLLLSCALVLGGCTTSQPGDVEDICAIFKEKDEWYDDAADASDEWGSPIAVMMAIMYQESRFEAKAKPPRKKILGFIPGPRPSSAYGYSQAKKSTWKDYKRSAGRYGSDRDDFADAIDFVGWYISGRITGSSSFGLGFFNSIRNCLVHLFKLRFFRGSQLLLRQIQMF